LCPVFLETYTPLAICNAYKTTGIWPFNPNAINSDRLDPSLITEKFIDSSLQIQPFVQPFVQPVESSPAFPSHSTRLNINMLKEENIMLKNKNELMKAQIAQIKEELNTYKNPGTCTLRSALKYPVPQKDTSICPASHNEESWQQLKTINEEAERKIVEMKQKKEAAAQKKAAQELNLIQKNEERARKAQQKLTKNK
ncbi:18863_t:CDS:2, partial [Funneliformis geosporum]